MGERKGLEEAMKKVIRRSFPVLSLLILAFAMGIVLGAFQYDERSRMLPLIIGIPTLMMLLVLVLGETVFPRVVSRFDIDLLGVRRTETRQQPQGTSETRPTWTESQALVIIAGWLITFLILIVLLGYDIAIASSVLGFIRLYGKQSWLRSVLVAIGVWAFIFLVFRLFMDLHMFPGLLFGGKIIT